jgi:hypothetical protein
MIGTIKKEFTATAVEGVYSYTLTAADLRTSGLQRFINVVAYKGTDTAMSVRITVDFID